MRFQFFKKVLPKIKAELDASSLKVTSLPAKVQYPVVSSYIPLGLYKKYVGIPSFGLSRTTEASLSTEPLLLLPSYKMGDSAISGLIPPPQFEELYKKYLFQQENISKIVVKSFCRVADVITRFTSKEDFVLYGLPKCFTIFDKTAYQTLDVKTPLTLRYCSFIQHMLVRIFGKISFSYSLLEQYATPYIDVSSYEDHEPITILTFIEVTILKAYIKNIPQSQREKMVFHLINDSQLSKSKTFFSIVDSKEQTGQKHADVVIETKEDKYYMDIKSYSSASIEKRRLSITTATDTKTLKEIMDIYRNAVNNFVKSNKLLNEDAISVLRENLFRIRNNKEGYHISKVFSLFMSTLIEATTKSDIKGLMISIILIAEEDKELPQYFKDKDFEAAVEEYVKQKQNKIEFLYPPASELKNEKYLEELEEMLAILMPEAKDKLIELIKA